MWGKLDAHLLIHPLHHSVAEQVDPEIRAVVVGWDPVFSYSRLVYASVCLRELPGCTLVATNLDHGDNIGNGRMMPGTGGLVAAVEVASGVKAVSWASGLDNRATGLGAVLACLRGSPAARMSKDRPRSWATTLDCMLEGRVGGH